MRTILAITFLVILAAVGDYLLKIGSSHPQPFSSASTHAGALMYLASGYCWMLVMQRTNLTVIGAAYAALTIVVLTALSLVVFKEDVSTRQLIGAGLAFLSVCLLIDAPEAVDAGRQ